MQERPFVRPRRVRAVPVKIRFSAGDRERWNEWERLSESVQTIANDCYGLWQSWHLSRGDDLALREWMAEYVAAKKEKKAARKCPVDCWPAEFSKWLWREIDRRHGGVHSRVRTLVINKLQKTLTKTGGTNSAWKRWCLILSGRGQFPSSSRALPIPFDSKNGSLVRNGDEKNPWQFALRLSRNPDDGSSELQMLGLSTSGYKNHGMRTIMERIDSGEYEFKGSNLLKKDGTWWIELCYTMPALEPADVDPSIVARLNPAARRPIDLWLKGRPEGLRRSGRDVRHLLRSLAMQFLSRAEMYKRQSSAGKGKGRKRATAAWRDKLGTRRKAVKKTYNEQLASDVVKRCVQERAGSLVFYQPTDDRKGSRFLELCDTYTGWDWFQLGALLARRCEEVGISLEICKLDGSGATSRATFSASLAAQPKAGKRVRRNRVEKGVE